MDSNGNQRKRGGRLSKNVIANETPSPTTESEITDVSAVAISPTLEEVVEPSSNVPPASECRRSSRKKIIKFDVRDLLNKNRKTHKIQIEARIDSNAPTTSKANAAKGSEVATSATSSAVKQDMLSKQKTFLEKSAIFRRYSISQEHKPPPLPLPPLLGKGGDNNEALQSATSTTKRLSRTQEFFSNVMIKPKQTTSLIVAQIESNTPSITTSATKRRGQNKSVETEAKTVSNLPTEVSAPVVQQKKRGRPARIKTQTPAETECLTATTKQLTPEKAKNWKEYKAFLAQQNSQTTEDTSHTRDAIDQKTKPVEDMVKGGQQVLEMTSDDSNGEESKECKEKGNVIESNKISENEDVEKLNQQSGNVERNIPKTDENKLQKCKDQVNLKEFDLECKSEDELKTDLLTDESRDKSLTVNQTVQEQQEDTSLLSESQTETSNKDHIDLSTEIADFSKISSQETEEINKMASESKRTAHNSQHQLQNQVTEILIVNEEKEKLADNKDEQSTEEPLKEISPKIENIIEIDSNSSLPHDEQELHRSEGLQQRSPKETQPSTPKQQHTMKTYSRTSSSSESENTSEHSSYSSAPSSASSSTPSSRSYKTQVRVSVKRISLPKSPSTSSQTSTSEELNPNVLRKKPPLAKRSKRLQKKFLEKLDDQSSFEGADNATSISSVSVENKFAVEGDCEETATSSEKQKAKGVFAMEKVSTRKSLRNRKENISESSDENQCIEKSIEEHMNVQEPKGKTTKCIEENKDIQNIVEEEPNLSKTSNNENKMKTSNEQLETQEPELKKEICSGVDIEQQENVSIECEMETMAQEMAEKASNDADIQNNPSSMVEEFIVTIIDEDENCKTEHMSSDVIDNTINSLKLTENIDELASQTYPTASDIQTDSANSTDSSNSGTKNISEQETITSPKRKSLRKQKAAISDTEMSTDSPIPQALIGQQILDDNNTKLAKELNVKENVKVMAKQKAKKARFKNLHDKEIESETDSNSTGKQTPIEQDNNNTLEAIKVNKEIEENVMITSEAKKKSEEKAVDDVKQVESESIEVEIPGGEEYATSSNLLSSQIQNVSIETNTLLDILRTVQSNTEAALKASKSSKTAAIIPELSNETTNANNEEFSQETGDDSLSKTADSPPLMLKRIQMSPTRSQSASPLNHNKSQRTRHSKSQSPTESPRKSPLLIKKCPNEQEKHFITTKEDSLARSEVESPSILHDIKASSSRSQTASPSMLKKSKRSGPSNTESKLKASKSVQDSQQQQQQHQPEISSSTSQADDKSNIPTMRVVVSPLTLKGLEKSPTRSKTASPLNQKKSKRAGESKTEDSVDNAHQSKEKSLTTSKEEYLPPKPKSPQRSKTESPLTLKGVQKSPTRLQTSSPLIHKKAKRAEKSNTEAALQVSKPAKDSTAILTSESGNDIPQKEEQLETKTNSPIRSKMESPLTLKGIQKSPSRSQTASPLTHKKTNRTAQSNIDFKDSSLSTANESSGTICQQEKPASSSKADESPTRATESPLTLKGVQISPTRSQSASPLIHLKAKDSPTRSNSSSPLTLKKVTRRYERRSRRGDESTHKTLEETFAEIAAQSSQAVLAAKEIDIAEDEAAGNETLLNAEQTMATTLETSLDETPAINNETVIDELSQEKSVDVMETLLADIPLKDELVNSAPISQDFNTQETKNSDNISEQQEANKTTPVKRGRKAKNRSPEVTTPATENVDLKCPTKTQKDMELEQELNEKLSDDVETNEKALASETLAAPDDFEIKKVSDNECTKESDANLGQQISSLSDADTVKENKVGKKRCTSKEPHEAYGEESLEQTAADNCKDSNEDDVLRTPKQSNKKRDSSQTKTETKSSGQKKLTKKSKSTEDEQQPVIQKDDMSPIPASTPPASKRGRKPKSQQETPPSSTSSKKKTKKDVTPDNNKEEDTAEVNAKLVESENEGKTDAFDKTLDEKLAKKKRQKKLKEAFEAALADDMAKAKDATTNADTGSLSLDLNAVDDKSLTTATSSVCEANESRKITCITPVEADEDPDPLKDIEKFIADGVNLLKKDYKLDEDSVDDVLTGATKTPADNANDDVSKEAASKTTALEIKTSIVNTFETPTDTPINTPSVTPPPKSPTSPQESSSLTDENSGVRRSHRLKLITKTPKALVGRGLVRDKERFSIKDDVETKIHYTLDDHLTGLAEVEAKNAKFLKEMEERLSNFHVIKENEYLCERVVSKEAKKMICDCFLTHEEEERGELGCGEDCLNRLLMIECGPDCNVKERCTNKRFQKLLCSPCRVFRTEKKGFGIMADIEILPGEFIMEYVGEVIDTDEFEKRRIMYSQDKNRHYYFMALRSDAIIDATIKGNISRFINHSCDPNAETQKWTVNGELRIGFFSRKSIMPGEEITFNYQYQRYGREAQRCYCESANCRGWIGQEPTSDEGEQIDDEEDDESEDDEEEEETDASNLLVHDDDEDSDASVADPEEVQKQLEMAAAQAEVELAPLKLLGEKDKKAESIASEEKALNETNKSETEEDSKSKFKKLLSKMAEKVAAKHKQSKREQKRERKKKSKESSADLANKLKFSEDPDIEDEVEFLKECGLKNQSDTLRLSRLMVRAKLIETRLNLLEILRKGDLPCRRLFLDYHGLRLLHGWMSEDAGNMQIRLALLQTLETLPIANKTVLTDSKVMQAVRNWCGNHTTLSPNEDSSSSNSNSQDIPQTAAATVLEDGSDLQELQKLALKLATTWEGLPEIFRIPKKERIEQMKEHEREADRQYAANVETSDNTADNDRYRRDRFGRGGTFNSTPNRFMKPNNGNPLRTTTTTPENIKNLSKAQRREMFAAKVARDEAEKRMNEERREFETKCRFFGLDPKKTRPQDVPFCVNPATGQWFSIERKPISTPPSYAHVQVPAKPKSTDPKDYQLPAVCATLPSQWKYAITPQGKIYYYHVRHRIPQWEPPTAAQLQQCENEDDDDSESEYAHTTGEESSDDDDDILIGMDALQLKAYIDRKVEARRQKRYQRLVDERPISVSD